jgi:hypothetical protein
LQLFRLIKKLFTIRVDTDSRFFRKEGLGFREARGAARYGALAVGVGLWYSSPKNINSFAAFFQLNILLVTCPFSG